MTKEQLKKQKAAEWQKQYRLKNKEMLNARKREKQKLNPEKYKTIAKKTYEKNKHKIIESVKKYYIENRETVLKQRVEARKKWSPEKRKTKSNEYREWRLTHKEYLANRRLQPQYRYLEYKGSAKKRKHEFTLTLDEFTNLYLSTCRYCGDPSKGIDRVDNSIGYSIENSIPCCEMCNKMKWSWSQVDFINKCKQIAKYHVIIKI